MFKENQLNNVAEFKDFLVKNGYSNHVIMMYIRKVYLSIEMLTTMLTELLTTLAKKNTNLSLYSLLIHLLSQSFSESVRVPVK